MPLFGTVGEVVAALTSFPLTQGGGNIQNHGTKTQSSTRISSDRFVML